MVDGIIQQVSNHYSSLTAREREIQQELIEKIELIINSEYGYAHINVLDRLTKKLIGDNKE